jgi:ubiquinone/menaquinone biosynthesis C-methylase UbiE
MSQSPVQLSSMSRALLRWTTWAWALMFLGIGCGAPIPADGRNAPPALAPAATSAAPVAKREPANVMSFEGAAWLEREGREEAEKPEVVLEAMELREGMTIAEIGAGTGFFSRRLARAVGPTGKVYGVDIQPEMLELLEKYAAKEGIKNIIPVLGTDTDVNLPAGSIDRLLLVDVYHEFQKPEPMLASLRKTLAPGGTVTLVEYRAEGDSASHINVRHRMTAEQVISEWNAAGFELVNQIETLPAQHIFILSTRRGARVLGADEAGQRPPA